MMDVEKIWQWGERLIGNIFGPRKIRESRERSRLCIDIFDES